MGLGPRPLKERGVLGGWEGTDPTTSGSLYPGAAYPLQQVLGGLQSWGGGTILCVSSPSGAPPIFQVLCLLGVSRRGEWCYVRLAKSLVGLGSTQLVP